MSIHRLSTKNQTLLKSTRVCLFVIIVLYSLTSMWPQHVGAASLPGTSIFHEQDFSTQGNDWLSVDVVVSDPAGIEEVRCYFRYDPSLPYVFVKMQKGGGNIFRGTMPPPADQVAEIEYLFMVVNNDRQAILTKTFNWTTTDSLLDPSAALANDAYVPLFLETSDAFSAIDATFHADNNWISYDRVEKANRFGMLAGLYSPLQQGAEAQEGYFGAFRQEPGIGMVAVKGFAITEQKSENDLQYSQTRMSDSGDIVERNVENADSASPPTVAGSNWRGEFWTSDDYEGTVISVTASIIQDDNGRITITTSKDDIGHHLSGTLYDDGNMLLYDTFDNEDWTTHYGPASETYIKIADFIRRPTLSDPSPPLNIIELTRETIVMEPILYLLLGK